jgi:hypothetical protein
MSEVVETLAEEYGWSSSVPNLSCKLKRGSLHYGKAVELANVLGYEIAGRSADGNTTILFGIIILHNMVEALAAKCYNFFAFHATKSDFLRDIG